MQINFSVLSFVAIGACFLLPAHAFVVDSKFFVARNVKTATDSDYVVGVIIMLNEAGEVTAAGFGTTADKWAAWSEITAADGVRVEEVPRVADLPIEGLDDIFTLNPELYSEVLPSLLEKYSVKIVADSLPGERLASLKPEDKEKIKPEVFDELKKLYDN